MVTPCIVYSPGFWKQYDKLPLRIREKVKTTITHFQTDPFYPSLHLHKLKGPLQEYWSISVTRQYHIIFRSTQKGKTLFLSVGTHAIYE